MEPNKRYKKIKILKEGGFGKAYLAEDLSSNTLCVIKETKTKSLSKKEIEEIKREANILKALKHPNIITFRDVYTNRKKRICIVMDYADQGDLADKIGKADVYFKEETILNWFTQLCLAIKHIHDRKIVHRDLKSQNIFLTSTGMIKLGDFGISKILSHTEGFLCTFVGTWYYISPEIIQSRPYNFKTDIWSLGVILYEMCCLRLPFRGSNQFILQKKIKEGRYSPIPSRYSRDLKNLVDEMLTTEPRLRPSIYQILAKSFIRRRISNLLDEEKRREEFSHTVLHNRNVLIDGAARKKRFELPQFKKYESANLVGIGNLSKDLYKKYQSNLNAGESPAHRAEKDLDPRHQENEMILKRYQSRERGGGIRARKRGNQSSADLNAHGRAGVRDMRYKIENKNVRDFLERNNAKDDSSRGSLFPMERYRQGFDQRRQGNLLFQKNQRNQPSSRSKDRIADKILKSKNKSSRNLLSSGIVGKKIENMKRIDNHNKSGERLKNKQLYPLNNLGLPRKQNGGPDAEIHHFREEKGSQSQNKLGAKKPDYIKKYLNRMNNYEQRNKKNDIFVKNQVKDMFFNNHNNNNHGIVGHQRQAGHGGGNLKQIDDKQYDERAELLEKEGSRFSQFNKRINYMKEQLKDISPLAPPSEGNRTPLGLARERSSDYVGVRRHQILKSKTPIADIVSSAGKVRRAPEVVDSRHRGQHGHFFEDLENNNNHLYPEGDFGNIQMDLEQRFKEIDNQKNQALIKKGVSSARVGSSPSLLKYLNKGDESYIEELGPTPQPFPVANIKDNSTKANLLNEYQQNHKEMARLFEDALRINPTEYDPDAVKEVEEKALKEDYMLDIDEVEQYMEESHKDNRRAAGPPESEEEPFAGSDSDFVSYGEIMSSIFSDEFGGSEEVDEVKRKALQRVNDFVDNGIDEADLDEIFGSDLAGFDQGLVAVLCTF